MSSASPETGEAQGVRGERARALVHATRGVQSRTSSLLAAGLVITLGVSALTWYYAHAFTRQTRARHAAQSTVASRAQSEMPLPDLGPIVIPQPAAGVATTVAPEAAVARLPLSEAPAGAATPANGGVSPTGALPPDATSAKTTGDLARERRLTGVVFTRAPDSPAASGAGQSAVRAGVVSPLVQGPEPDAHGVPERSLDALLRPGAPPGAAARLLPDTRFLLPRGAFIDCTLETAIDSTLPGMTTCVTATDTFGADGRVVLLERGTKLIGETRGQVQQGQARIFVVWTQARTPTGVNVPLDSPGTDELGRSGLPGQVQRHFWERFGAAMLVSLIEGAVQAGVQASSRTGGTVVYAPSASQDVLTEVMKQTLRIAPTIVKRNGDRIQVLVARDIDFRTVYELRAPVAAR